MTTSDKSSDQPVGGVPTQRFVEKPDFPYHDLANQWPLMEGGEFAAFKESIRKDIKIRVPVVLLDGKILDGRNRQRVAQELGMPLPVRDFNLEIDGAPEEFVIAMNDDRRHEGPDVVAKRRRERQLRVAAKREKGESTRAIAKEEGISQTQVCKDLESQVNTGRSPENGTVESQVSRGDSPEKTVTGLDRKKYPKKKSVAAKKAAAEGAAAARADNKAAASADDADVAEDAGPEELADENGVPLPDRAVEAFRWVRNINNVILALRRIKKVVNEIGQTPAGRCLHAVSVGAQIAAAAGALKGGRPAFVCPYCKGKDVECRACDSSGWVTALVYDQSPEQQELKAKKAKAKAKAKGGRK
jgi:hypothetical protein